MPVLQRDQRRRPLGLAPVAPLGLGADVDPHPVKLEDDGAGHLPPSLRARAASRLATSGATRSRWRSPSSLDRSTTTLHSPAAVALSIARARLASIGSRSRGPPSLCGAAECRGAWPTSPFWVGHEVSPCSPAFSEGLVFGSGVTLAVRSVPFLNPPRLPVPPLRLGTRVYSRSRCGFPGSTHSARGGRERGGERSRGVDQIPEGCGRPFCAGPGGGVPHRAGRMRRRQLHRGRQLTADPCDFADASRVSPCHVLGGVQRPQDPDQVPNGLRRKRIIPKRQHQRAPAAIGTLAEVQEVM